MVLDEVIGYTWKGFMRIHCKLETQFTGVRLAQQVSHSHSLLSITARVRSYDREVYMYVRRHGCRQLEHMGFLRYALISSGYNTDDHITKLSSAPITVISNFEFGYVKLPSLRLTDCLQPFSHFVHAL